MAGKIVIDPNIIYQSANCGPYQIIEDMGRDERCRLYVKIRFINTGTEKIVRWDSAMDGRILDELYDIDFEKTYYSYNYGPFKILSFAGRNNEGRKLVKIRFLNTGYECIVLYKLAKYGKVKDVTVPIDKRKLEAPPEIYDNYVNEILKERWKCMMSRCYNPKDIRYNEYGELGVTVCDLWKDFNNYKATINQVKNYDRFYNNPSQYHLDKDYLQFRILKNQKVYSPQTCIFLNYTDNNNLLIKENYPNRYHGIRQTTGGNYQVIISINNRLETLGTYSNLIAALNEYNFYYLIYGSYEFIPLLNDNVPFMTHREALTYLTPLSISRDRTRQQKRKSEEQGSTTIPNNGT